MKEQKGISTDFEAGREIAEIGQLFRDAITKSIWYDISARRVIDGDGLVVPLGRGEGYYPIPQEFLEEAKSYLDYLSRDYRRYVEIRENFPNLSFFNDYSCEKTELEMTYSISETRLNETIQRLEEAVKNE